MSAGRLRPLDPPKGKRILGLDISSVSCGYAVFEDEDLIIRGHFRQSGDDHGEKLANFGEWLTRTLGQIQPTHVLFEMPYPSRKANTYGVLMLYVAEVLRVHWLVLEHEVPDSHRIGPRIVKSTLKVPKGQDHLDNKRIMVRYINKLYGLHLKFEERDKKKRVSQDDEADAIALVLAARKLGVV